MAAAAIAAVAVKGQSADEALARHAPAASPRSAIRAVTLGCLRWYLRLDALAASLLAGRVLAPALHALLLAALHQLEYSRNPPQATVSSAVDATRLLQQARAAGLMNALLRRFLRERSALIESSLANPSAASAHPQWLLEALQQYWPEHWQQIIDANNAHPPMTLRLDLTRVSRAQYQARLAERGLVSVALPWLPAALILEQPVAVAELPGFAAGLVSVQDAGAQLAAALLAAQPGERVLDACAAPGGKSAALLEAVDGAIELTAVDIDGTRMQRVADNLQRLRRHARLVTADLRSDTSWWDGNRFDRILVDAPCSATGVIRRHPDIKLLRRAADIGALAHTQRRIVEQCLQLLKPGGCLLYSTCSVLPEENERVIEGLLAALPAVRARSLPPQVALPPDRLQRLPGIQLLPGNSALTDGFYYACLTVT
jgi:16S rRNA (cytosine967-C5)-methyltransferase